MQNHPPGALKSPKNPAIPDNIYNMVLDLDFLETSFQGHDHMVCQNCTRLCGISCRNIAKFLSNLETHQIHQKAVDVKILHPVVLCKEGTWAIDLTRLKKVDIESLTTEKITSIRHGLCMLVGVNPRLCVFREAVYYNKYNSSEFKSNECKAVTTEFEIKHIFSDIYNPWTLKMAVYR
jgi:hypothetical protein